MGKGQSGRRKRKADCFLIKGADLFGRGLSGGPQAKIGCPGRVKSIPERERYWQKVWVEEAMQGEGGDASLGWRGDSLRTKKKSS